MSEGSPNSIHCSFLIPVFQEQEALGLLFNHMDQLLSNIQSPCEVILVDDGSTDQTPQILKAKSIRDPRYQSIFLSKNFGQQRALLAGLRYAKGDVIMILDADLQDPPDLYFQFIKHIRNGFDVAYGIRQDRKEGTLKKMSYSVFYRLFKAFADMPVQLDSGDFSMMSKRVAQAILRHTEDRPFLRGLRSSVGFSQIGVPYERHERAVGKSKYSTKKLIQLALDGLFNFTAVPIRLLVLCGVFCITGSLIYFAITIYRKIIYGDVPTGFSALLFSIILFGGFQLLSIGIIGEYIQRIFFQVKRRPNFIISSIIQNGTEHNAQ